MAKTFEQFIGEERARLQKVREDSLAKRKELDEQIAAVDRELQAITAYEQVKLGKAPGVTQEPKARRTAGARAPRGSREELKNKITELLKQHSEGLVASQITTAIPEGGKANSQRPFHHEKSRPYQARSSARALLHIFRRMTNLAMHIRAPTRYVH